jgi:hypothetical protein
MSETPDPAPPDGAAAESKPEEAPAPVGGLSLTAATLRESDPVVVSRVAALSAKLRTDPALRAEVEEFEAVEFVRDGADVVATLGPRTCRLTGDAVVLGRTDYPQTKRIPL